MKSPFQVRTRGGLLVGLIVTAVIGFELRTVLGMLIGFDVPMTPYLIVMVGLLSVIGIVLDVFRTTDPKSTR
jgi:hypothetical protein